MHPSPSSSSSFSHPRRQTELTWTVLSWLMLTGSPSSLDGLMPGSGDDYHPFPCPRSPPPWAAVLRPAVLRAACRVSAVVFASLFHLGRTFHSHTSVGAQSRPTEPPELLGMATGPRPTTHCPPGAADPLRSRPTTTTSSSLPPLQSARYKTTRTCPATPGDFRRGQHC